MPVSDEALVVTHGLLKLQWKNAKITSAMELLRLFFSWLARTCPCVRPWPWWAKGGLCISAVLLHKRMRRAAPFVGDLGLVNQICG